MLGKYIGVPLSIILLIISAFTTNAKETETVVLSDELTIKEFIQDAFLITHSFPWAANSLIVKLKDDNLLWIDTPYTPEATALVLDWMYKKYGNQITVTEINTGFHIDNLGGNAELKKRGIAIYGSDMTCTLLTTQSAKTMIKMDEMLKDPKHKKYRDVYRDFVFTEPIFPFNIKGKQIISIGSEIVEIFYPGPAHTYDNLIVYIRSRKILFGGCMILSADAKKPGFIDDSNIREWAESIRNVRSRYHDIEFVVPGHGNIGSKDLLNHTIAVVNQFSAK